LRFVSPALKHIVFPALSRSGYLRHTASDGPAVVTYHGVFPLGYEVRNPALDGNLVHADSLRRQLKLLTKRYHVISPEDFLRWSKGEISLSPRSILLTCDDALRNTLTEMLPILRDFGVSCLFFATGASADETPSMLWYDELYLMLLDASVPGVSKPVELELLEAGISVKAQAGQQKHACWWNLVERLSQFDGEIRRGFLDRIRRQLKLSENWRERVVQSSTLAARFLMLDRTGLRQLAAEGMTIGAHTLSHPILAQASEDLAWREISESRKVLEKVLDKSVWAFGYPFGNAATVTGRDVQLAERAGFQCAFMNTGGGFGAKADSGAKMKRNRFALPRVHVTADMSLGEFEAHISGFYRLLRKRLLGGGELEAVV
jgi:peptidoglycan/xylan/chitin deacetylase (PgdA/CDA1 family)